MVISIVVANFEMKKIMIDSGNSIDILFYDVFKRIKLLDNRLKPAQSYLYGFIGEAVVPKGVITLSIMLGISPYHLNLMIDFIVVKVPSEYNMSLGRQFMRIAKEVLSTYHLVMKFPTKKGIGEVRSNQIIARKCYLAVVRGK